MIFFLTYSAALLLATSAETAMLPRGVDHDHIAYVRPYAKAVQQAREEGRILIVRPFPVGGVADGSRDGRWCPLADYMRAVTLSDETVTTLVNRRFVFTYFSLVDWADLSDADAKRAILRVAPEYGAKVRQTPPTFFLSPEGDVLATLETLAPPHQFLDLAKNLLAKHPEYARPSPEEAELRERTARDPHARLLLARLQIELADVDGATRSLETLIRPADGIADSVRADALHLLAQRARIGGDAPRAEHYLTSIDALASEARAALDLDLRIERAYLHGVRGNWRESLAAWKAIEAALPGSKRLGEILYGKGLSYYHLGKRKLANHSWVRVLKEVPEGRYYQPARLAAMGPTYYLPSPDLVRSRKAKIYSWRAPTGDPSRLPGSELGYGTSSRGHAGTERTPEQFLRAAYRDYDEIERRRARSRTLAAPAPARSESEVESTKLARLE